MRCAYIMVAVCCAGPAAAAQVDETPSRTDLAALARSLAPSMVQVETHLRYDHSDTPQETQSWWSWRARQAAQFEHAWEGYEELIREDRPATRLGFLIGPTTVVAPDLMIQSRFVAGITVRLGDTAVDAEPVAYALHDRGMILALAEPLAGGRPLVFEAGVAGPYVAVTGGRWDGGWSTVVQPVASAVIMGEDGRSYTGAPTDSLIVGAGGMPAGMSINGKLYTDGSWKGSPADWPGVGRDDFAAIERRAAARADACVLHTQVSFRSPRSGETPGYDMWQEQSETEWNGLGVLVEDDLVMVLGNFEPKKTARIERIAVSTSAGETLEALFAGSLKRYGCLMARLERPLADPAVLSRSPLTEARDRLLVRAEVSVHGEQRTAYYGRERIPLFYTSWEGQVYPAVTTSTSTMYGATGLAFLMDLEGRLVALPIERRYEVTVRDDWDDSDLLMTPADRVAAVLADWPNQIDPDNIPLTEEQESRLAWLGVELQPMDPDLARMNGVSAQTASGTTGAIVTYVYAGSPAADAGLGEGDILLRLHIEGDRRPFEIMLDEMYSYYEQFPWDRFDEIPEEYFDQIPTPWGSVENSITRGLTDVGFGTRFVADVFREGAFLEVPFEVTESPPHYAAARRFKSEPLGLTVRNLTYEVRRYFQMREDDAGVIVSRIQPGSPAAIAGLRPFEIITAVGDQPIRDVASFETTIASPGEHRLAVSRMAVGRIVRMKSPE